MNMLSPIATKDDHTFDAQVMPLYGPDAKPLPMSIGRAVTRSDTGETIAIAGPNFTPVQHHEIVKPILHHLETQGYALEMRDPTRNNLEDLRGKKGAFVKSRFTDNGAVMRTDIITGDFINPTGASSYLDDGEDTMLLKLSVFNSHNGTLAVRVVASYERLVCLNGMTKPEFSAGVYGKHTSGFNLLAAQRKIGNALDGIEKDAETFGRWAKMRLTIEQAESMLKATMAKLPNKPNGTPHYSEPMLMKILEQYAREDQTAWGLYNAVTHWQTHAESRSGSDDLKTTIGRESKVAAMLKSPAWQKLLCEAA